MSPKTKMKIEAMTSGMAMTTTSITKATTRRARTPSNSSGFGHRIVGMRLYVERNADPRWSRIGHGAVPYAKPPRKWREAAGGARAAARAETRVDVAGRE